MVGIQGDSSEFWVSLSQKDLSCHLFAQVWFPDFLTPSLMLVSAAEKWTLLCQAKQLEWLENHSSWECADLGQKITAPFILEKTSKLITAGWRKAWAAFAFPCYFTIEKEGKKRLQTNKKSPLSVCLCFPGSRLFLSPFPQLVPHFGCCLCSGCCWNHGLGEAVGLSPLQPTAPRFFRNILEFLAF